MKKKLLALAIVLALVVAMIVPMAVSASTGYYVANGGDDSHAGTSLATAFATIGHAVSVAISGDTINVAAGTYVEPTAQILISKNLTIVGAGAATTILKPSAGTGAAGHIASLANGWFAVSPNVTFNLSNVTLDGAGYSIGAGVLYDQASGTVNNCTLENIQSPPYLGMGIAAYNGGVDNTAPTGTTNVNVTNCTFSNIGRIGIYFYAATGELTGTISGNKYTGKGVGTWLDYFVDIEGGTVTISNNTVTACLGVASDGSTSAGMNVATYYNLGTTATITGNTVSNCSYGINVGIAGGIHGADYSTVIAHNNNLAGNTHGFASLTLTSAPVDATNNWWGTAVPSAIIPLIEGNVTYIPYLNSAPGSSGSGTTVSGTMPEESITVGAPSAIGFGQFVLGMNSPVSSSTSGTVTAFANTWQVNVTASNGGFMRAAQDLATQLQISDGTISWVGAGTGFSYLGNPTSLPFEAEQNITGTDISHGAGSYTITITFTGALTN